MPKEFVLFSASHISAMIVAFIAVTALFFTRRRLRCLGCKLVFFERTAACFLLALEVSYHVWMWTTGRWRLIDSLPLELCSIALLVTIALLWTGDRRMADFVLFAGIGGAIQALVTPVLGIDFPHFRFFHFFLTHTGIILTGLYYVWIKGHQPSLKGIWRAFLYLNVLAAAIMLVNKLAGGNYMFLDHKPSSGSLLDYLGPYPWYIGSLEIVALATFLLIWLALRKSSQN